MGVVVSELNPAYFSYKLPISFHHCHQRDSNPPTPVLFRR